MTRAVRPRPHALVVEERRRTEQMPGGDDPETPKIGRWYWVRSEDDSRWLGCVTHVGSNYVEIDGPEGGPSRIHVDEFWDLCEFVDDPEALIKGRVTEHQTVVHALMQRVRDVTARLAITPGLALPSGSETSALALRTDGQSMEEYSTALTLAKEKTLPELFEEIRKHNTQLGVWLSASLIPLKAQAASLAPAIKAIENRIFSVVLYAGLAEDIEQVREGEPAPLTEPVHVFQRRAYCDEECLAQYETGGMAFKDMRAFDRWLARDEHMNRLLPFPRCLLAFQVRRNTKDREWGNLREFLQVIEDEKADKLTYLYIRNGEQLFRLSTSIEFDEKLFPDMERGKLDGKLWAYMFAGRVDKVISDNEYQGLLEEERAHDREVAKLPKKERFWRMRSVRIGDQYHAFTRDSVYYDDIAAFVAKQITEHNRLVLVLQGLLDRSPVLHPHPPWQLWSAEGFQQALRLIYDDTRALVAGDQPDFEAYRAKLNASLADGSITVGQEDVWLRHEGKKESDRMDRDWRTKRGDWRPTHHHPPGNPGPGLLAHVLKRKRASCTYQWARERAYVRGGWNDDSPKEIGCAITVPIATLFNVSAYKPGDFKVFFADPRTRAEYLKWAPMLLVAEEYHAGNRKVRPLTPPPPRRKTDDGGFRYRQHKRREALKALVGKAVRLTRRVTTQGGSVYEKNSLWRVSSYERGTVVLYGIDKRGREEKGQRCLRSIDGATIVIDDTVPLAFKEAT